MQGCHAAWTAIQLDWTASDTDENQLYRAFDFLALHRAAEPPDNYLASLYACGKLSGQVVFIAPAETGMYRVSVVRDFEQVLRAIPGSRNDKEFLRLAREYRHQLAVLGQSNLIEVGSASGWEVSVPSSSSPCDGAS